MRDAIKQKWSERKENAQSPLPQFEDDLESGGLKKKLKLCSSKFNPFCEKDGPRHDEVLGTAKGAAVGARIVLKCVRKYKSRVDVLRHLRNTS